MSTGSWINLTALLVLAYLLLNSGENMKQVCVLNGSWFTPSLTCPAAMNLINRWVRSCTIA